MAARGESRTDWERLRREPGIELDEAFWRNARVVMPASGNKKSVHLRVDADVLDWFRAQGRGYLTRMNAVLRAYYEARRQG
jgi:uncharacterized protein (DUF4415 family)